MAEVWHAVVSAISPSLKIRLDGSLVDTPVDQKGTHVPTLAVNDEVLYVIVNSKVIVTMKVT